MSNANGAGGGNIMNPLNGSAPYNPAYNNNNNANRRTIGGYSGSGSSYNNNNNNNRSGYNSSYNGGGGGGISANYFEDWSKPMPVDERLEA